ncbi:CD63 antigen-like [Lycorma delicatula]|uniref:CD63 antigen-like n=1 Tax=Lycorma delicatula TaxID=130591 RepID=UPI003F50ED57
MILSPQISPGMKCIKYLLILFNLMFMVTGLCVIIVGTAINSLYAEYAKFLESQLFFSPSAVLVVVGCIIFTIAFLGCFGALRESTCMVTMFSTLLAFIFVIELAVGLSGYFMQDEVKEILVSSINETMHEYRNDPVAQKTIDSLQQELHCCGIQSPEDWEGILSPPSIIKLELPMSCCERFDANKHCEAVQEIGCLPQLKYFLKESSILLAGTAITIATIQLIGVMFAYSLGRMIRFQKTERERQRWEMRERLLNNYSSFKGDNKEIGPIVIMTVSEPQKPPKEEKE